MTDLNLGHGGGSLVEGEIRGIELFLSLALSHLYAVGGRDALAGLLTEALANGCITEDQAFEALDQRL